MAKLLNIPETQNFLKDFASKNDIAIAFIASSEGGLICSNEPDKIRLSIEVLSNVWQTMFLPDWKRSCFEWESAYVVLINMGSWIFGIQQNEPNPTTLGMLRYKAQICADHIFQQL